jgi:hypothetical protein
MSPDGGQMELRMSVKMNSQRDILNKLQNFNKLDARLFHIPISNADRNEIRKVLDDAIKNERPMITIVMGKR